jgi:hypothetical protein
MVPLTRGSTAIWRSIIAAIARVTASMSALTKFTVTGALARPAGREAAGACACEGAGGQARPTSMAAPSSRACLHRAMCRGEVILIRSK